MRVHVRPESVFSFAGMRSLDPHLWINKKVDLVDDALNLLGSLPASNEKECYLTLQAYGNLFLGIAHIGLVDKLTKGNINYVSQAFNVASGLEDVWHKGRGIASFLTVLGLIGLSDYATKPENYRLKTLVSYMDASLEDHARVEQHPNEYVFSILLMLNCIGVLDKLMYLEYKRDWVKVSGELINTLPLNLKAIFSHYLLSTLDNLGLTHRYTKSPQKYLHSIIDNLTNSDESELDYMAYTYCVDISHKLNLVHALPDVLTDKLVENISTSYDFKNGNKPTNLFYRSGFMRLAYTLMALSQVGMIERLLENVEGNDRTLIDRLIENHIENWGDSDESFTTLHHALIDLSLSQRGKNIDPSVVDRNIAFQRDCLDSFTNHTWSSKSKGIALHAYFPGMTSRRSYTNISRDLYEKGNSRVRSIFEDSAEILSRHNQGLGSGGLSRFFFEEEL